MKTFLKEELAWASRTATQLRFIQADCADLEPEARSGYIQESVQSALKQIVPEKRSAYLEALSLEFPLGEYGTGNGKGESEPVNNSPDALVDLLVQMAPMLKPRKLQELGLRLQEAGYLEIQTTALIDEPPPELLKRFPIQPGRQIDLQRTFRLLSVCADFILSLDQVAWPIWRKMAPHSQARKDVTATGDFRESGARYLTGDTEVAVEQISQIVERLRKLVASVIGSIGPASRGYAQKHSAMFGPDAIKDLANLDGGGWVMSVEQKCWRKYCQLAKEQTIDAVEGEIIESMVKYAEGLMRGTGGRSDIAG
jgi:hypothetical protein